MKRLDKGPRLKPKHKNFVRGSYIFNPVLNDWQTAHLDAMAEYTRTIAEMDYRPQNGQRSIALLIQMRARLARIRLHELRLIIAWKRRKLTATKKPLFERCEGGFRIVPQGK